MEEKKDEISFSEYQEEAAKLISPEGRKDMLRCAALGLCGESGECADIIKKTDYMGHPLDPVHLREELGDVLWYVSMMAEGLGISLADVAAYNLDKLHKRYHGSSFSTKDSLNRVEYQKKKEE